MSTLPSVTRVLVALVCLAVVLPWLPATASAQPLGTFRWQQQPYCNVLTLNVVQAGAVYQVDGFDDQCGAATRAAASGLAFPNPNGTIGFGLTIVSSPGGTPVHLDATIDLASLSGTWRDSSGATGPWTYTPGAPIAGSARPLPRTSFPGGLSAAGATIANVASPTAATDAATKGYVDTASAADRALARQLFATTLNITAYGALTSGTVSDNASGCLRFGNAGFNQIQMDLPLPFGAVPTAITVKYMDTSTSSLSIGLRTYTFQDGARSDNNAAPFFNTINGTGDGSRVQTVALTSPQPVSAVRGYTLNATGASADGQTLAFCGAQVTYTIP